MILVFKAGKMVLHSEDITANNKKLKWNHLFFIFIKSILNSLQYLHITYSMESWCQCKVSSEIRLIMLEKNVPLATFIFFFYQWCGDAAETHADIYASQLSAAWVLFCLVWFHCITVNETQKVIKWSRND